MPLSQRPRWVADIWNHLSPLPDGGGLNRFGGSTLTQPQWDFVANEFRAISLALVRSFPDFNRTIHVRRDEIADETSLGASLSLVEL
jgi:hypothetical protein